MSFKITLQGKSTVYSFNHPQDRIGEGNLAYVYRGEALDGKVVAIKVLKKEYTSYSFMPEVYQKAVEINLESNHLMQIYDYIVTNTESAPKHHLIMEFVQGASFDQIVDRKLTLSDKITYTKQLLQGLHELHSLGYLHRDIKPSNLMLGAGSFLKITDYDTIIKKSEANKELPYMGTLSYSSPEHVSQEPIDERADIWAAGVFLYRLIFNNTPFADIKEETLKKDAIKKGAITYPDYDDRGLLKILEKALKQDRNLRYRDALSMKRDLEELENKMGKWWYSAYSTYFMQGTLSSSMKLGLIITSALLLLILVILLING